MPAGWLLNLIIYANCLLRKSSNVAMALFPIAVRWASNFLHKSEVQYVVWLKIHTHKRQLNINIAI